MRSLFALALIVLAITAQAAELTLVRGGAGQITQATVETQHYKLLIDAGLGARLMSLVDKQTGVEVVQKDPSGLGGLFEDRPIFSVSEYSGRVVKETPEEISLRFAVTRDNVNLTKTYTFYENRPVFSVRYEIENATQLPFKLWIRNFGNPGGGPVTDADHGFLRNAGKLLDLPVPGTYYKELDAPWAAYLDTEKQSGYFVRCGFDLLDSFYFWSDSRITPTFEWIYKPVPPGQKITTGLLFGLINGISTVGDITADGTVSATPAAQPEPRTEPQFAAMPDWKPLEELYKPTAEETARGFITVVSGKPAPAPRLTELEVDLGLDEKEAVPVEVFALAEQSTVRLSLQGGLTATLQTENGCWLADGDTLKVARGLSGRLWLKLNSTGLKPGKHQAQLSLASGQGQPVLLPLRLTVWNVKLPAQPLIGSQLYAYPPTLSSYDLNDAAKRKFLAYVQNMQELGCDSCDWACGLQSPAAHVKVKQTGQLLKDWSKEHPDTPVDELPELDFSYYDIWFNEYASRGMTRFVAHVPSGHTWREASFLAAALGHPVEDLKSPVVWQVLEWYYRQLRQYAEARGFTSFWAKLDDEIPQEHIPVWLEAAKHYRAAGYKPFTTNTGNIARSATLLQELNKESEAWQVALCLSRDFLSLVRKGATYETRRDPVKPNFAQYGNGEAVDTWATRQPFFAGEMPPARVDEIQVYVGNVPLKMRDGSGWGNKDRGVAMTYGGHLYVSLPDGGDPNQADVRVSYRLRTLQEGGEPAVKLEPTDELWYYGGGSYQTPYEAARAYPWRVCAFNMTGYGWWTYLWHDTENIMVKLDPQTYELTISPAWEGLRDGNEDAAYFRLAERKLQAAGKQADLQRLRQVFAQDEQAPLRMGEVKREIYAWDDFLEPTSVSYNTAKRMALEVLAGQ